MRRGGGRFSRRPVALDRRERARGAMGNTSGRGACDGADRRLRVATDIYLLWRAAGGGEMRDGSACCCWIDLSDGMVSGSYAERQGFAGGVGEAGVLEHLDHDFAVEEGVDGAGEIFVGTGAIAADPGGSAGQDVVEVEAIEAAEGSGAGQGELEDHDAATGAEDAVEFADGGGRVGDVSDTEGDGDDVDRVIGHGQAHGVGGEEAGGVLDAVGEGVVLPIGDLEHGVGEVGAEGVASAGAAEGEGEVTGAAGDVEDDIVGLDVAEADGGASPGLIAPEGVDAVVEVVVFGDGGEHFLDAPRLFGMGVGVGQVVVGPCGRGTVGGHGVFRGAGRYWTGSNRGSDVRV